MSRKGKLWVLIIFVLALLLRTINISNLPPGFTPDEASFGYDAYSILKTGHDQWGHLFPTVLESFGDFKSPIYSYLAIPFIAILGLNETAVRLPNAILGSLAVVVVYYMVIALGKLDKDDKKYRSIAALSAVLLTISPWHIMMSRGAFEANLTTFFLPLGVLEFAKGIKGKKLSKHLVYSGIIFGLNLFTYHSAKLVTPLVVVVLAIFYKKYLLKTPRKKIVQFISVLLVFAGLTVYSLIKGAGRRASDVGIWNGAQVAAAEPRLVAINGGMNPTIAKVLHNKYQVTAIRFIANYKQYYSYDFLFDFGPNEATYGMIPGRGVLYSIELLPLIGFIALLINEVRKRRLKDNKFVLFVLSWLVFAPIPAALASGVGYAGNRSVIMLPALQISLAFGAIYLYQLAKNKYFMKLISILFILIISISSIRFLLDYSLILPFKYADAMLYGRREMVEYLNQVSDKYDNIIVSRSLSEPHIYIAFYNQWKPVDYQNDSRDWERYKSDNLKFLDQLGEYRLGKYIFTNLDNENYVRLDRTLFVGKPEEFAPEVTPLKIIKYPDGRDAIYIVDPDNMAYAMLIK